MQRSFRPFIVSFCLAFGLLVHAQTSGAQAAGVLSDITGRSGNTGKPSRPNILFIIMDDVGIDQMKVFGYGGATPPLTPNIDAIAKAGVRFRNVWAMPECSPSRAIFFEGRYPLRTNVFNAILSNDLANSQVSPFEVTTPQVLREKQYTSGLFGKFHLATVTNNEFTTGVVHALGWDYFDGFLDGAPHPIDTTIGNQYPVPPPDGNNPPPPPLYSCGFIPNTSGDPNNGADQGACVQPDRSCTDLARTTSVPVPGFKCVQQGGIFVKNETCSTARFKKLSFDIQNAYYVWDHIINKPDGSVIEFPLKSPAARGYISDSTTSAAVAWIKQQNGLKKSWMSTVSYANAHTPYQQPPEYLLPGPTPDTTGFSCTGNSKSNQIATRVISNQMIEAMDTEIGNLMVSSGLAQRAPDGSLDYHPEDTNTMVVVIGDNGTFAPGVKEPFDVNRAKGFVYQTGVWVPLIVSGPLVVSPDREVKNMVNIADLFQLFGEIAGIDVRKIVPKSHILDSQPMLAYLTNPNQPSIRTTNFTQTADNIHPTPPAPCVIALTDPPTCVQLFNSKQLCNFEGGAWYGDDPDGGTSYPTCCAVKRAVYDPTNLPFQTLPIFQQAVRDDNYKLVRKSMEICAKAPSTNDMAQTQMEFYQVNENVPVPAIDKDGTALCEGTACPAGLNSAQVQIYNQLNASLTATLASETPCPGDGNLDKVVNSLDIAAWTFFATHGVPQGKGMLPNTSSWYDFNIDGKTNLADLQIILGNFGARCGTK